MRGLMATLIVAGGVWLLKGPIRRWIQGDTSPRPDGGAKKPAERK
jgi:hypothetical protein